MSEEDADLPEVIPDPVQCLGHIAGGVRFEGGDWLTLVSGCPVEEIYRSFSFCLFCI